MKLNDLNKQEVAVRALKENFEVNLNVKVSEKGNIPFKSISKTGKLVNAYNALILASRSKRK